MVTEQPDPALQMTGRRGSWPGTATRQRNGRTVSSHQRALHASVPAGGRHLGLPQRHRHRRHRHPRRRDRRRHPADQLGQRRRRAPARLRRRGPALPAGRSAAAVAARRRAAAAAAPGARRPDDAAGAHGQRRRVDTLVVATPSPCGPMWTLRIVSTANEQERALRATADAHERRFSTLTERSPIPTLLSEQGMRLAHVNDAFCTLVGRAGRAAARHRLDRHRPPRRPRRGHRARHGGARRRRP